MGRKPNPLILQFFERGPKLADHSNRYPHRCKACGENFPKGRIDSLVTHLTKKCPAISPDNRINAVLALHGVPTTAQHAAAVGAGQGGADASTAPRNWTPLETLAEASRQVHLTEKEHGVPVRNGGAAALHPMIDPNLVDGQEELTTLNGTGSNGTQQGDGAVPGKNDFTFTSGNSLMSGIASISATDWEALLATLPPEFAQLAEATANGDGAVDSLVTSSNLDVAAAAAARLNPTVLDPAIAEPIIEGELGASPEQTADEHPLVVPERAAMQPWGQMTDPAHAGRFLELAKVPPMPAKGGKRMLAPGLQGASKTRHTRARFDPSRRKEVQEVRKIGACIRCRILRKTCSKGDPCDTCRKVLTPRIWRGGCVRTKLSVQLDLYTAGVQVVLAQNKINSLKNALVLESNADVQIMVALFHDPNASMMTLPVLVAGAAQDASDSAPVVRPGEVVMVDNDKVELPSEVDKYMKEILGELINREAEGSFIRITLDTARSFLDQRNDFLLRMSLDLWGLVEILDRERQWTIFEVRHGQMEEPRLIKDDTDHDIFDMICLQLTAAAERRAAATSLSLMNGMQRILQDSKNRIDFGMFLTAVILLSCIEKTTWAFKAWEQDNLRQGWPLQEKQPAAFTPQGHIIAEHLRMLLAIRRCLPRTVRGPDGKLVTVEEDETVRRYFERINLNGKDIPAALVLSIVANPAS